MSGMKAIKRVMAYIYMPLLFCLLGYGIFCVSILPIVSPYYNAFQLFLSDSGNTAAFTDTDQTNLKSGSYFSNQDTVDEKQVQMPAYGTLYAEFEIADASIRSNLYFGDSSDILEKGLGQYNGSHIPGYGKPILICGHNNGAFNRLQYVHEGEIATITTSYGLYQYKITGTRIANEKDKTAYDLNQDKEQLILYTCYPFDTLGLTSQRFFVYADKVSGPAIISGNQG